MNFVVAQVSAIIIIKTIVRANLIIVRNGNVGRVYVRVERSIGPEGRGNRQGG